jgi:hypothetical protein
LVKEDLEAEAELMILVTLEDLVIYHQQVHHKVIGVEMVE